METAKQHFHLLDQGGTPLQAGAGTACGRFRPSRGALRSATGETTHTSFHAWWHTTPQDKDVSPHMLGAGFPRGLHWGGEGHNGQARASTRVTCTRAHDAERGKSIEVSAPCWGLPHRAFWRQHPTRESWNIKDWRASIVLFSAMCDEALCPTR